MICTLERLPAIALTMGLVVTASTTVGQANGFKNHQKFRYIFPLDGIASYPTDEMISNCGGEFPDARAWLQIHQKNGQTSLEIKVRDAVPDTFFTVWLRLATGSPLTGAPVTPLANPSGIEDLQANVGTTKLVNGFHTNRFGHGSFKIHLDYPLVKGAFQFQEHDGSLNPLAINDVPFRLRLASHCVDQVGHGLLPGKHEMWFDWP